MTDLDLIDRMPPWVTPSIAARITGVPYRTVQTWVRRGRVPTMCILTGQTLVHWPSVDDRACLRRDAVTV